VHSKHLLGQIPAVIIDGRIVSLLEVLQHAYTRRQCEFLDRAIDHYLIEGAARRDGIEVLPEERERLRAQFFDSACQGDANGQQSWLRAGDLSEEALNEQLEGILRFGKLKGRIADAWVTPVFERHREQFAAVSLAQIVVPHQSAAKRLMSRLQRGADFAQLMHAHSEDQAGGSSGGFLGRLFYADLPPNIATRVREAAEGQILGPFPCGDGWTLYRVERHWPPILNAVTRTRIHHAIFNSWLACKRQRVELRIPLWENL
jgi:hypothetical protein